MVIAYDHKRACGPEASAIRRCDSGTIAGGGITGTIRDREGLR